MRLTFLCLLLMLGAIVPPAVSQSYSIDWFTIDGGGGTSTGGVFSVVGTIGQPDAGKLSGGNYSVEGGFWGIIAAIQTPGAPLLTITPAGSGVIISWPSPSTGFGLEQNPALGAADWTSVTNTISDNGTLKSVTVPAAVGSKYYRLFRP